MQRGVASLRGRAVPVACARAQEPAPAKDRMTLARCSDHQIRLAFRPQWSPSAQDGAAQTVPSRSTIATLAADRERALCQPPVPQLICPGEAARW